MPSDDKPPSVTYLQAYQAGLARASRIVIVGGGAVGVQMACDLKELYGSAKDVTLVHSRDALMPRYHPALSALIKARFADLGVRLVTGTRVVVPADGGFNAGPRNTAERQEVLLQDGRTIPADFVIVATGQTPNNQLVRGLAGGDSDAALVNPQNGFVRVRPTMQFADQRFPNLFAVGDIADSGAHKAARPGQVQAAVAARNIASLVGGGEASAELVVAPASIHITLGLVSSLSLDSLALVGICRVC